MAVDIYAPAEKSKFWILIFEKYFGETNITVRLHPPSHHRHAETFSVAYILG